MSAVFTVSISGSPRELVAGTTAADVFSEDRTVIVARVNGVLRDLSHSLAAGDAVEPVTAEDEEGLAVLRHSTAHVLAQAVQQLFPKARLGIGPPIRDGFYYDFDVETPFTPQDLKDLEKAMQRIVKETQQFRRRVVTEDEARLELADEPYKLELIGLKADPEAVDGGGEDPAAEAVANELTIYDNVRKNGEVAWKDLCRGPHVPTTKILGNGYQLLRSAAAYWRGQETNPQLQRIYGTAWSTKAELMAYLERFAEAERRDHRKLGTELDLFSFPDEIGSGLAVFHPRGGIVRREMEDYSRRRHEESGYEFVYSPHITKANLFETSGHLHWYKDGMFPPMHVDSEFDAEGNLRKPGQDYYLKPMNCPFHCLIFDSRGRSYRELPLRMFEFGTVYRYEKSGVVHGLTRVRGLTQDDSHIYCSRDQMADELQSLLTFVLDLLRDYGLDDFYLELSTRNAEKSTGTDEDWAVATKALEDAAAASGLNLVPDPGGAAFYGPKISVQVRDAIGRSWQLSTIQLDFNMPAKFNLQFQAADGTRQRPVMIHRALFGSIERFFGVLTEHYAGAFPPWLAPVQAVMIPVSDNHVPYLDEIAAELRKHRVRVDVDDSDDRMPKKIRTHTKQKVPFMLIAGDEDIAKGAVSFRFRDGRQDNGVPVAEAVERILVAISSHAQV